MLDVDHGTYPFVTSSSATAGGACTGSGVGPTRIDRVVAVAKAYTTRVGEGPFPTELLDDDGEWLRQTGGEFGTTTGRPRRCGWYDAVVVRYASRINGLTDLVVTKLDVLTGRDKIPVAVAYDVNGRRFDEMPDDQSDFHHATPIYEYLDGWTEDISGAREFDDLPVNAQRYLLRLEEISGARISLDRRRPRPRGHDHPARAAQLSRSGAPSVARRACRCMSCQPSACSASPRLVPSSRKPGLRRDRARRRVPGRVVDDDPVHAEDVERPARQHRQRRRSRRRAARAAGSTQ